ncbi:hypothetical protein PG996_014953 [Apiospora saccharicola]|uniref:Rhodopsin domain-containing protein n=1 Tax=Apiospora saccharicola TaxID=335842 RepID=A0ABR1TJR7_9PEZI
MIVDIIILTIPIPMVWRLMMPVKQKIAVTGIFLLGAFVVGISAARVYFFFSAGSGFDKEYDITYNLAPTLYWTQLESAIAVISACLPTMRVLFLGFSLETLLRSFASTMSILSTRGSIFRSSRDKELLPIEKINSLSQGLKNRKQVNRNIDLDVEAQSWS